MLHVQCAQAAPAARQGRGARGWKRGLPHWRLLPAAPLLYMQLGMPRRL